MIIPLAAGQGVAAQISGRLVGSRGPRIPLVLGGALLAAGAAFIPAGRTAWTVPGGCGLLALLLGIVTTGRWAQSAATRNGERLAGHPLTEVGVK